MNPNIEQPSHFNSRWSNRWYVTALLLAALIFGLRGLDGLRNDHFAVPVSVYPAQSDRILL